MGGNVKHGCVHYKDKLYSVGYYVTIHAIDETEYALRRGHSPDLAERRIELLRESIRGEFTGKYFLYLEGSFHAFSIFQCLYQACINASSSLQLTAKYEELFESYLQNSIYLHDSVFKFFKEVIHVKKLQLFYTR